MIILLLLILLLAIVGEIDDSTNDGTLLFTHRKIDIGYNGDQVHVVHTKYNTVFSGTSL